MITQELLVDVRSAAEFASGALSSDIAPTINIEYQVIDQLPNIYAARGIDVTTSDNITLYCRSGRRSNIALQTLRRMGYQNVRDIGGFEDARKVLDREQVERQLAEEIDGMKSEKVTEKMEDSGQDAKEKTRAKSFMSLLDGLKALEG